MRYLAIATDYDETLATAGKLESSTVLALEKLRHTGRRILLVTGRILEDLAQVCPRLDLFDCIVAENGAILYFPLTREKVLLSSPPPLQFIHALQKRVPSLSLGSVIAATVTPHDKIVSQLIQDMDLDLQIIFNKGAVMILPRGIDKVSGLTRALHALKLSFHEVVGIGDAENDLLFLQKCECSVAVANALDTIKSGTTWTTKGSEGLGVVELIESLISHDLQFLSQKLHSSFISLGKSPDGSDFRINLYGQNLLATASSKVELNIFSRNLIENLLEKHYQVCVISSKDSLGQLAGLTPLGISSQPPHIQEIISFLEDPNRSFHIQLSALDTQELPVFFSQLYPVIHSMRSFMGRPHCLLIHQAHQFLPVHAGHALPTFTKKLGQTVFLSQELPRMTPAILQEIDILISLGKNHRQGIQNFCKLTSQEEPLLPLIQSNSLESVAWLPKQNHQAQLFRPHDPAPQTANELQEKGNELVSPHH